MVNFLKTTAGIALLVGVILIPWALVWALNTLFPLTIPYTFKTWLAGFVLLVFVNTNYYPSKKA